MTPHLSHSFHFSLHDNFPLVKHDTHVHTSSYCFAILYFVTFNFSKIILFVQIFKTSSSHFDAHRYVKFSILDVIQYSDTFMELSFSFLFFFSSSFFFLVIIDREGSCYQIIEENSCLTFLSWRHGIAVEGSFLSRIFRRCFHVRDASVQETERERKKKRYWRMHPRRKWLRVGVWRSNLESSKSFTKFPEFLYVTGFTYDTRSKYKPRRTNLTSIVNYVCTMHVLRRTSSSRGMFVLQSFNFSYIWIVQLEEFWAIVLLQ